MRELYEMHLARKHYATRYDAAVLQTGMYGDPWRVVLASMLLQQTTRRQAQIGLQALLGDYTLGTLAMASLDDVAWRVRPCGLQQRRARMLTAFSRALLKGAGELGACLGVGPYVLDAVSTFCYGIPSVKSGDRVLQMYVKELA